MNEPIGATIETEQPVEQAQPEAPPSVAEHAAQFGTEAQKQPAEEQDTADQQAERAHPSAQQKRDRESGQFQQGRQRVRSKDAVQRIDQLTGRAKTAEERLAAAEAEITRLKTTHAPPAQIARAEQRVEQAQSEQPKPSSVTTAFPEPKPVENDPKFGGDYAEYLDARAEWAGRKAVWEDRQADKQQAERAKLEDSHRATLKSWTTRVEAAKGKYQDFEAVAFAPTNIPTGSLLDAFIMEDDAGAEILYHLQSHPEEVDSLLAMPVLGQAKHLALLSQRFLSDTPTQAGTTGSVTGRNIVVLPHRPPNPVRTEAQRASEGPPTTDGSLSIAEHRKAFGSRR